MSGNGINKKTNQRISQKKKSNILNQIGEMPQNDIPNNIYDEQMMCKILQQIIDVLNESTKKQSMWEKWIMQLLEKQSVCEQHIAELRNEFAEKYAESEMRDINNHNILEHKINKIYGANHIEADIDDNFVMMNDKKLKYQVTVEFLNDILKSMNRKTINNIKEFKDVPRDDLLTDECNQVVEKHIDKLIKVFGKTTLLVRNKDDVEHYIMTLIRKTLQVFDMKLTVSKKNIKNGDTYRTSTFYSVA